MSLYYDSRIRTAVVERWAASELSKKVDFSRSKIPEDLVDPEDSALLKDTTIPLVFKNDVARDLYKGEDEEIKAAVRSKRNADMFSGTVYSTVGEERAELVRAYQE
jgi:hypothetical protein